MSNVKPLLNEKQIEQLESEFPVASGVAFSRAYKDALASGLTVVVSDNGSIFEVSPDGQRRLIKTIVPPTPAEPGQKYQIP